MACHYESSEMKNIIKKHKQLYAENVSILHKFQKERNYLNWEKEKNKILNRTIAST